MRKIALLSLQLLISGFLFGQTDSYNKQDFYLPGFNSMAGNEFRSANGSPGAMYWQNSADYLIHALLSEKDTTITGEVTITYTNNSPDKLDYLWLQLDQNVFAAGSRGSAATPVTGDRFDVQGVNHGGFQIVDVILTQRGKSYKTVPVISDTRMQLRLNSAMLPKGDKIVIKVSYSFAIPSHGADRLGRLYTKKGVVYEIAQWYPRMCVYDDVEGWNTLPYMGLGEFYCDYGNFDYYITAPSEMIVYGSGDLQNPAQVLTVEEIQRLSFASKSDKTVTIIKPDEIGKPSMRPVSRGNLTWHFTMKNTRDVAWAASAALVWDAAKINLPSGRKAIAMSAYPTESLGDTAWSRATEYLKNSIEIYSKNFFEYPWNSAVSIGAIVTGMEYPGMIFNDYKEKKAGLWFLVSHEIGHNWYPMIVGSNERRYMWQDEGFNAYINYYATDIFNNGEYAKDPALYKKEFFAYQDVSGLTSQHDPLMVIPEAFDVNNFYPYYGKTAYGLKLLRNVVIGKDRFDYAFRKYTEAWAYKHPTPYDFFHFMNSAAGEDLNWFWKEWFFTNWTLDQAITDLKYVDNDPSKGALITIENKGKMMLPAIVKVIESNNQEGTVQLPVEIWQRGGTWTFKYPSKTKLSKVILDPENILPDVEKGNNVWGGGK
ncbi:MAG: M1 family metallopeptidase [Ginsengibacter sp.]